MNIVSKYFIYLQNHKSYDREKGIYFEPFHIWHIR
jgi:hypothetical protein